MQKELAGAVFLAGYVVHIFLALVAYLILIIITHDIKDKRIIALLFLIIIPSLFLSGSYFLSFYGLSTIFLAFIAGSYYKNFRKCSTGASCLVFIAFLLIALSQAQFLLETVADYWYVTAQVTQALGYMTLLLALLKIRMK